MQESLKSKSLASLLSTNIMFNRLVDEKTYNGLVPDSASPVMRDLFLPSVFSFLHCIVKEKIYQNGVYRCIWMLFEDLSPDQFNTPYATAYITC
jgi:hypothetical protein